MRLLPTVVVGRELAEHIERGLHFALGVLIAGAYGGFQALLVDSTGFVEQTHFTEGDSQVVMRLWIFIRTRAFTLKLLLEFAEHVGKINAGTR